MSLENVFNKLSIDGHIHTESVTGVDLFKGSDENGTGLEKDIKDGLIEEGFQFVSLEDLGTRGYDINNLLKSGRKDEVTRIFKDYGVDNIFTSIDSFPPDFIVFYNGKIYCVEAKKTGGNSIRYGDNLPKPDFIYVLRDTKNNIQTFYYGDEIISVDKGDKIQELREDFKEDVKKLIEKYDEVGELSNGLFSFSLRAGVGATKGGKKTNPSLSPYRKQREQRVLETING